MKKVALVVALIVLVVAASGEAGVTDDKEFRAGLKQYHSRNYQAAVQHFKAYAAHSPHPAALYLIGYSLYKLGKFSEADEYFREAFFIYPEFSLYRAAVIELIVQVIEEFAAHPAASFHPADDQVPIRP